MNIIIQRIHWSIRNLKGCVMIQNIEQLTEIANDMSNSPSEDIESSQKSNISSIRRKINAIQFNQKILLLFIIVLVLICDFILKMIKEN